MASSKKIKKGLLGMHSSKTVTLTCGRVRRSADLLSGYVRIIGEPSKTSIYNNWSLRIEHFSVRPPLVRTSLLRQMSFKQHWLINCRNCNEISICRWSEFHEMNSLTSTGMRCVCNNFNSSFLFEFADSEKTHPKSKMDQWRIFRGLPSIMCQLLIHLQLWHVLNTQ